MIVSERRRAGLRSCRSSRPSRTSEPSTRMLLPLRRLPPLESAFSVVGDTPVLGLRADQEEHEREEQPAADRDRDPLDDPADGDVARAARSPRLVTVVAVPARAASGAHRGRRRPPAACAARGRPCTPGGRESGRSPPSVYLPAMPPRRVIGIDAGGTKLLGGVVDEEMVVHHRVHRTWRGADRQETLDIFIGGRRGGAGGGAGGGGGRRSGSPRWWSARRACRAGRTTCRSTGVPFRDLMCERLGLPVLVDNDGNAVDARRGAHRGGEGRPPRGDDRARDRDRRRPLAERRGVPGRVRARRRDGARGAPDSTGRTARATAPASGCLEALVSGNAIGREGLRVARGAAGLGARAAAGGRQGDRRAGSSRSWPTTATRSAREVLAHDRASGSASGWSGVVNMFNPEVIVIGGGAVRGGRPAARARPARWSPRARAAADARAGASRARPLRRRGGDDRRRAAWRWSRCAP